jgi:phage terminase Nu1 subunit (DNA packaging protein)
MINIDEEVSQCEFSMVIGVSEPLVSKLIAKGVIMPGQSLREWIIAYCQNLREQAAGRSLELSTERAGLAKEQKLRARIAKLRDLGEWAPIENMTLVLSRVTTQMASTFDNIPVKLKRAFPELTSDQLNIVRAEINEIRNLMVSVGKEAVADAAKRLVDYVDEFDDGSTAEE